MRQCRFIVADQGNQTSVFRLQKTKGSCRFCFKFAANKGKLPFSISSVFCFYIYRNGSIYICTYIYTGIYSIYLYLYMYICCRFKRKTEARAISFSPFTVCLFVDKETNGSYPFANRLNGLNGLAHPWA